MMQNKQIDAIITEDTDLIAHGNNEILYKMDFEGSCFSISFDNIKKTEEFATFGKNDFLIYCILCV